MSDDNQRPVCKYCGSEDISVDASARWNNDKRDWEISGIFDGGHCDACEREMKFFNWINIKPEKGRAIPEHHSANFEMLHRAFANDDVALMTCGSKEGTRTVICMVNRNDNGSYDFIPVGEMCEAKNPFEHYIPPSLEQEDGT